MFRIAFVNLDFPPIGGPGVFRVLSLAKYAALSGHEVRVYCGLRSTWHDLKNDSLLRELPATVNVARVPGPHRREILGWLEAHLARARAPLVRRVLHAIEWRVSERWPDPALIWGMRAALRVAWDARRHGIDCVVTSGPPHISHLAGWFASRLSGTKWIMDYRDLWTDDATQASASPRHRAREIRMERAFLRQASAVVTVSPSWVRLLDSKCRELLSNGRVHLIRNGHDLSQDSLQSLGTSLVGVEDRRSTINIAYTGAVQAGNDVLDAVLHAIASVRQRLGASCPRFTFTGLPSRVVSVAQELGIDSLLTDVGYLPHASSLALAHSSDALLVMVKPLGGGVGLGTIPGKVYEALALRKRVLFVGGPDGDAIELLRQHGTVFSGDASDVGSVATAIQRLTQVILEDRRTGAQPSNDASVDPALFSRRAAADSYLKLIGELCRH